ncbi:hypothetical protein LCGC14_0359990 [marine sediment metagenome]|uniref:Uncharacterized protein n=1 Tax=marine sediment metagenome TaxID=412755 RepID=A0A0F9T8A9_9ZZZZ
MPGLPFEDLPAAQTDEIKNKLHGQWQIEAKALDKSWFPDKNKFATARAKLNAKYQRLELDAFTKLQEQQKEQQQVQQLIANPQQRSPEDEALLRMQLRPEAESLVFPEGGQISPSYLRSKGFIGNMQGYAGAAEDPWGPGGKDKQSLIDQYQRWRESELYSTKSISEQQQLDREWDMLMASSRIFNKWWSDKTKRKQVTEVKALRSTGKIAGAMRDKVTRVTPLGISLGKGKHTFGIFGSTAAKKEPEAQAVTTQQKPIIQQNKRTGQKRISNDGGKTWRMIG